MLKGIVGGKRCDEVMKDRGYRCREGMQWWRLFWVADANVEELLIFFASCTPLSSFFFSLRKSAW